MVRWNTYCGVCVSTVMNGLPHCVCLFVCFSQQSFINMNNNVVTPSIKTIVTMMSLQDLKEQQWPLLQTGHKQPAALMNKTRSTATATEIPCQLPTMMIRGHVRHLLCQQQQHQARCHSQQQHHIGPHHHSAQSFNNMDDTERDRNPLARTQHAKGWHGVSNGLDKKNG